MRWSVPRIWEGGDVWILGGGSSVVKQFGIPDNIVQDVMNKISPPTIYSPYMESIHNKHIIAINVAFLIGNWMDMIFFGDNKFFLGYREQLAEWPGLKVTCHAGCEKYTWVKFLQRDTAHPRGISSNPEMVAWNANSGSAAISIAANAGAKRIFLLGFDMNVNPLGNKHWHTLYKGSVLEQPSLQAQRGIQHRRQPARPGFGFVRHLKGFPVIAQDARKRNIEIINVNPESAISEFPKCNLKDVL